MKVQSRRNYLQNISSDRLEIFIAPKPVSNGCEEIMKVVHAVICSTLEVLYSCNQKGLQATLRNACGMVVRSVVLCCCST